LLRPEGVSALPILPTRRLRCHVATLPERFPPDSEPDFVLENGRFAR
jgi:hypothetical protein